MSKQNPKKKQDLNVESLQLSVEERFVLSQLDGTKSSQKIGRILNRSEKEVTSMLDRLSSLGAIDDFSSKSKIELGRIDEKEVQLVKPTLSNKLRKQIQGQAKFQQKRSQTNLKLKENSDEGLHENEETQNYRKLYHEKVRMLAPGQRIALVQNSNISNLHAFCFDPDPYVIQNVISHPEVGLSHARLIARHHRNPHGLEHLAKRVQFLKDSQVQKALLKNPQLPQHLLQRLLRSKRLMEIYQLTISREITERNKGSMKRFFREQFQRTNAEERVHLIIKTEARCLRQLVGLSFDGKTIALLCKRPMNSTMLIRGLAQFPSLPPQILIHLCRQPIVKRQKELLRIILRHPNAPSQLKNIGNNKA